jgi:hypothetical protein
VANVIRILRGAAPGPVGKTEGEPYWLEADRQFGVVDAAGVAQALIAVRYFSAAGTYAVGDHVIEAGVLYHCTTAVAVPGPFDPTEWAQAGAAVDLTPYATITYVDAEIDAQETAAAAAGLLYPPLTAGATKPLTGELHLPAANPTLPVEATHKQYVDEGDDELQLQIDQLSETLVFVGSIDVVADACVFTVASGLTNGPLPAPDTANRGFFVIVTTGGTGATGGNIPPGDYVVGDWIVSDGAAWTQLPIGQTPVTAPQVALSPDINSWGDTQVALQDLFDRYLHQDSVIDAGTF